MQSSTEDIPVSFASCASSIQNWLTFSNPETTLDEVEVPSFLPFLSFKKNKALSRAGSLERPNAEQSS